TLPLVARSRTRHDQARTGRCARRDRRAGARGPPGVRTQGPRAGKLSGTSGFHHRAPVIPPAFGGRHTQGRRVRALRRRPAADTVPVRSGRKGSVTRTAKQKRQTLSAALRLEGTEPESVVQEAPQLPRPARVLQLAQRLRLDLADALA